MKELSNKKDLPVWHDSDDENVIVDISENTKLRKLRKLDNEKVIDGQEYTQRLREFHGKKVLKTKNNDWVYKARKERLNFDGELDDNSFSDNNIVEVNKLFKEAKTGKIYRYIQDNRYINDNKSLKNKNSIINHNKIDIKRLPNANIQSPSNCVVKSIEFHKGQVMENGVKASLLSVSGWDKRIKLFNIDGINNKLLLSLFFDDFPIFESGFTNITEEIIFLGPNSRIGVYDLLESRINFIPGIAGRKDKRYWNLTIQKNKTLKPYIALSTRDGNILVLDEQTKQLIRSFKMNDSVTGLTFHPSDENKLISTTNTGEIYIWDINMGRCKERVMDYGSLCISSIVSSSFQDKIRGNISHILTGSTTGYVNIYSLNDQTIENDKDSIFKIPKYTINNLCTSITSIAVHPKNEIAAISSKWTKDSLRLINLYTGQVYSNWPTTRTPLKYITSLDFSEHGGFLASGNDKGDVLLYRINNYI